MSFKKTKTRKDEAENQTVMTAAIFVTEPRTFVQHGVSRLVPGQRLFGQVLVGLCQTFHLSEASVESHGRVTGVLGHVQVSCPPQLLLNHQSLLQQLQRGREGEVKCERQRERHIFAFVFIFLKG